MKIKKLVIILLILFIGYTFINKNKCPEYIDEFVQNYPQAKELKTNYQPYENNKPIKISITNDNIPLLIQWDKRWAYTHYGDEIVGTAGCGPTCLSMVAIGLTQNTKYNPRYIAKYAIENDYLEGSKTKWSLMEQGCQAFGLKASTIALNKNTMIEQLNQGHPIICSVRPGEFTNGGHFIVITKTVDGNFYVNDPNSKENSKRTWTYETLAPQIKALWAYSKL